jgi:hypothetical protein
MRPIASVSLIAALALVACNDMSRRAPDAESRFDSKDYSGAGVEGGLAVAQARLSSHELSARRRSASSGFG